MSSLQPTATPPALHDWCGGVWQKSLTSAGRRQVICAASSSGLPRAARRRGMPGASHGTARQKGLAARIHAHSSAGSPGALALGEDRRAGVPLGPCSGRRAGDAHGYRTPSSPSDAFLCACPGRAADRVCGFRRWAARLWLRRLDSHRQRAAGGNRRCGDPFWSPDSRSVGFFADSKLKRIDIGGGSPQTLANATDRRRTWSPDGTILFRRIRQARCSAYLRRAASRWPRPSRQGRAATAHHTFFPTGGSSFLTPRELQDRLAFTWVRWTHSDTKRLAARRTAGADLPSGWLLFHRGRRFWHSGWTSGAEN